MSNFASNNQTSTDEVSIPATIGDSDEVDRYLRLPQIPLQDRAGKDQDPLPWWKEYAFQFPFLSKMARQFLAAPASSASVERLFSAAGKMHDDQKKSTTEGCLESQLIVSVNYPDDVIA